LRKSWGLNDLISDDGEKNRNDHRHHAIDALVISMTTRAMVKKVADAAKKEEETKTSIVKHIPKPWLEFNWDDLQQQLDAIMVSHKPDHGSPAQQGGTSGRMHEDTYYGYAGIGQKKDGIAIVVRKPLLGLTKMADLDNIRDAALQSAIKNFVGSGADIPQALKEFSEADMIQGKVNIWKDIQRVRIIDEKPRDVLVDVKKGKNGNPIKLAQGGSNHCAEIYCPKNGKKAGKWQMEVIKTFDANQKGFVPEWYKEFPDAAHMMTLHINDIVAYDENGQTVVVRVQKIGTNGQIFFMKNNTVKSSSEDPSISFMAGSMQSKVINFRRILVEVDGSIYDPLGILTTVPKIQSAEVA
jgi:CRISPR-associated endonuclease Csn1